MGKTIRFGENSLIAIKKRLNEIMAGSDDIVSHNDVSAVKLYHGTTIDALLMIMESGVMSAKRGKQHGETYGINWFSLENGDNFNKGALFSIEVPGDVFNEKFSMMNRSEAVSREDDLDITSFNLTIEKICGFSRENIQDAYNRYASDGEAYPLERVGYLFDHYIEKVQDSDTLFPSILFHNWDKYFPMIMKNILGNNISESVIKTGSIITENTTDRRVNRIIAQYSNETNFQKIRDIRSEILKAVPNARTKNDKYLGAVAMYYLTGCLDNTEDRFKLNYFLGRLNKGDRLTYSDSIFDEVDFGMTPFNNLKYEIDQYVPSEESVMSYKNIDKERRIGSYTIFRIDSYDDTKYITEILKSAPYWCIFDNCDTFNKMTDGYTVYLCVKDGYEKFSGGIGYQQLLHKLSVNGMNDIIEKLEEYYEDDEPDFIGDIADSDSDAAEMLFGCDTFDLGLPPYDEYGLSMFIVMVSNYEDSNGNVNYLYSRYNLSNLFDGDIFSYDMLSQIIGGDAASVFVPYNNNPTVNEGIAKEFAPVAEIGMEAGGGPGKYAHMVQDEKSTEDVNESYDHLFSIYNTNKNIPDYDEAILYFKNIESQLSKEMNDICNKYGCKRIFFIAGINQGYLQVNPNDLERFKELANKCLETNKKIENLERKKESIIQNIEREKESAKRREVDRKEQEENDKLFSLAIEEYGLSDIGDAGYILPDGELLNFGRSNGNLDHTNIAWIYQKNNIGIWDNSYRSNYITDFLNHGAIRCDVNIGLLDMAKEPTKEQYSVINTFVRYIPDDVNLKIDFSDNLGNPEHSVSYSNPNPQRVVSDIYKYYNEGLRPLGESKKKKFIIPEEKLIAIMENMEKEVESSEVDLSSFKKRDTLPPGIWKDEETLNSKVRLKLLDIADDFWEFVNLSWVEPKGIIITGSICNFNWSKFSDIDLHLIVDFNEIDEKTEFVKQYLDSKKNEWNNEHEDLKIMGFPVELYVQNIDDNLEAGGIYDLEENKWIRRPNPHTIKNIGLEKFSIKDKAASIMTIIDNMYKALSNTGDGYDIRKIGEDASYLWDKIKDMRKSGLKKSGESSPSNIVYKCLRRTGYLDKLWKMRTKVYDKSNSITEAVTHFDMFGEAKKMFGITTDIRECGFILPDGTMLDFSGKRSGGTPGRRGLDHRKIELIGDDAAYVTLSRFIEAGAIRCSLAGGAFINLMKKPTPEQCSVMSRLIRMAGGDIRLDIGDDDVSIDYVDYEGANYKRIINDIINFFDNKIKPSSLYNISESVKKYLTVLKEEVAMDGSTESNPYEKRWKAEREALKNFIANYGKLMQSREDNKNGKLYKVYFDESMSNLIGYNYCICVQWNEQEMKPGSTVYIRALDKFTPFIRRNLQFDTRGRDNVLGNYDDTGY